MLAPLASGETLTLESDLGENLPNVWADHDMLLQAILNLVSNAIKYTNAGGHVLIKTWVDDAAQQYLITVTDNGMGISIHDLPHIFDKFYRSEEGRKVAKGTGMGLTLVKQVVEKVHQGEISVTSEHGAGTTFELRFPIEEDRSSGR